MKAIIYLIAGASAMYLYMTGGDISGLVETSKMLANEGATYIKAVTD